MLEGLTLEEAVSILDYRTFLVPAPEGSYHDRGSSISISTYPVLESPALKLRILLAYSANESSDFSNSSTAPPYH